MPRVLRIRPPTAERSPLDAEVDEAALVALAKRDRHAFAPLCRRYVEPAYRYRDRCLDGRELAEDATSLIFTKALEALPGCREEVFRRSCGSILRRDGSPSRVVL